MSSVSLEQIMTLDQAHRSPDAIEELRKLVATGSAASTASSQALTYLCLHCMNSRLNRGINGLGFLSNLGDTNEGIPKIAAEQVPMELWYSCRFWIKHLLDVPQPLPVPLLEQLKDFLERRLVLWMELVSAYGQYEGASDIFKWTKTHSNELSIDICFETLEISHNLRRLYDRLGYMDRLEEALVAARDRVEILQGLCAEPPDLGHCAQLTTALTAVSAFLGRLGYYQDSQDTLIQAIELQNQLVKEIPSPDAWAKLADSHYNHSVILAHLQCHDRALEVMQEGSHIYRRLASIYPTSFNPGLALSIQGLATRLGNLGHYEESLTLTREALEIRRHLEAANPGKYKPELSQSLYNLGIILSDLKRNEEALEATNESVDIYWALVDSRPEVFSPDLAEVLNGLSAVLNSAGRHEEALTKLEVALGIYRKLAADRPTAYLGKVASNLINIAIEYSNCNLHDEAKAAADESVELYESLADKGPMQYGQDLLNARETRCEVAVRAGETDLESRVDN
ncbi:hypothetical protein CTheo_5099 [Ceratobasidium theobromae]|uniref:TPR-like protein n=1 Tax=Ceratobasidium theobromae TaxID=1582974 RepID=A0A5N5QIH1_9AGAM|nr:hypothetical protein CTheo_5099 [Ceratobasidium theobromae]